MLVAIWLDTRRRTLTDSHEDNLVDRPYPDGKREYDLIGDSAVSGPIKHDHERNDEGKDGCDAI